MNLEMVQVIGAVAVALFGGQGFWTWLSTRKASNKQILSEIKSIRKDLDDEKQERIEETTSGMRWFLLSFARECRKGEEHDKEQWSYALNQAKRYETYCKKHEIENGVIEADTAYIRGLYEELSRSHKLL